MDAKAAARIKEIVATVRPLAAEYYRLSGKPLGATGEVAEYVAAELLGLELAPPRTQGYDAIRQGPKGPELIQIKGRAFSQVAQKSQKLGRMKTEGPCDVVLLVLLDNTDLAPKQIWEAPFSAVLKRLLVPGSKARDRGVLSASEFKRIAKLIWGERRPPASGRKSATTRGTAIVNREERKRWQEEVKNSAFNMWFDPQTRDEAGHFSADRLYAVARTWQIQARYDHLNEGLQRMQIGNHLRRVVPPEIYGATKQVAEATESA